MNEVDVIVIGGGIVGLATAWQITQRFPGESVVVLEKERAVGMHQTGHNSGVLHSGIYYRPGSLKATNCRSGKQAMEAFCREHGIAFEVCGKVIVATEESELPALDEIERRGKANGVDCERVSARQLAELEPHAKGVQGLHVPETGIVNFGRVAEKLAELLTSNGQRVVTHGRVTSLKESQAGVRCFTREGEWKSRWAVNCGGLYCDRIARMAGLRPGVQIVPFRGEYYELVPSAQHLCRNLIYPVPDPRFPFLGVHFTRMIEGGVECGPNAVLAFAREGYRKTSFRLSEFIETVGYLGFWRLVWRYWRTGCGEMWRSVNKAAFVRALQHLVPAVTAQALTPGRAGVRAQAVTRDGRLADDFIIEESNRMIHVLNAPSPAATSSLNIGRLVTDRLETLRDSRGHHPA